MVTSNGSADPELYSDQDDGELLFTPENLQRNEKKKTKTNQTNKHLIRCKNAETFGAFKQKVRMMNSTNSQPINLLVLSLSEVTETQHEPVAAPEPVPVVERPLRSRGKGPLTAHTPALTQHTTVRNTWLVVFTERRDVEVKHHLMLMFSVHTGDARLTRDLRVNRGGINIFLFFLTRRAGLVGASLKYSIKI